MKAVVISGGIPLSQERAHGILEKSDYIICADKGAEYAAEYGITPDLVVGDMDSADMEKLASAAKSRIILSPGEKDFTDTHLAVIKALEKGADEISIICGTGLRSDHSIANIRLLLFIENNGSVGRIIDDSNTIYLCTKESEFLDMEGAIVSIIALSDTVEGICLEGFKYPLDKYDIDMAWTTGISNVVTSTKAKISIESGRLLVFEVF